MGGFRYGGSVPEVDLEAWTRALSTDGYRPSVIARRLIEERGLTEEAATQMVQRICQTGRPINLRAGEATLRMLLAVGAILAGFAMFAWPALWPESYRQTLVVHPDGTLRSGSGVFGYDCIAVFLIGIGLKRLIFAMANRNDPNAPYTDSPARRPRRPR
jgi:hypothetical protein